MGMSLKEIKQRVSKCANVTKVIMGICFLILFILGFALFVSSAVSLADAGIFKNMLPITNFREIIIFALCIGFFVALVSIIGSIGYFALHKPLLIAFMVGMGILVVLELSCIGVAYGYRNSYAEATEFAWHHAEASSREYFEETYLCCGGMNATDYPASPVCLGSGSFSALASDSDSYSDGCVPKITQMLNNSLLAVGGGVLAVTILEIIVIITTIAVVVQINKAMKYQRFKSSDSSLEGIRDS